MEENKYKGIEKFINPEKLSMELVPDIYDEDIGKVLRVNSDLDPYWGDMAEGDYGIIIDDIKGIKIEINNIIKEIKDKVSIGDFEGALESIKRLSTSIDIMQGQIDMMVEETSIIGAYAPGNNDRKTNKWVNIVNPSQLAVLNGVMFEGESGWIGSDGNHRLMLSGNESVDIMSTIEGSNRTLQFCVDAYIKAYTQKHNSTLIDGVYLSDDDGYISIKRDGLEIRTKTHMPQGRPFHIAVNVSVSMQIYEIYIDGEKIETTVVSESASVVMPKTLRAFNGFSGEVFNIKIYKKSLTPKHIKENFDAKENTFDACYHFLSTLHDASKVVPIISEFDSVKSELKVLKDEIRLGVSSAIASAGMSNVKRKVRYIRDTQEGNNVDNVARWLEVQAVDAKGTNMLEGVVATSNLSANGLDKATDGNRVDDYSHLSIEANGEKATITFDLGEVSKDIMMLKFFRYHFDSRVINGIKTEVSEDGEVWANVFDGNIKGKFKESIDGQIIVINAEDSLDDLFYRISKSEIKITDEAIVSSVFSSDRFNDFASSINQRFDSIILSVSHIGVGDNLFELTNINEDISHEYQGIDATVVYEKDICLKYNPKSTTFKFVTPPIIGGIRANTDYTVSLSMFYESLITINKVELVKGEKPAVLSSYNILNSPVSFSTTEFTRKNLRFNIPEDFLSAYMIVTVTIDNINYPDTAFCIKDAMVARGGDVYPYKDNLNDIKKRLSRIDIDSKKISLSVKTIYDTEEGNKNLLLWTDLNFEESFKHYYGTGSRESVALSETQKAMKVSYVSGIYSSCYGEVREFFENNKKYTISLYAKGTSPISIHVVNIETKEDNNIGEINLSQDEVKRYYIAFSLEKSMNKYKVELRQKTGEFTYYGLQLEKGYKPTEYSPSHDEVSARIKMSEIKLTDEYIEIVVGDIIEKDKEEVLEEVNKIIADYIKLMDKELGELDSAFSGMGVYLKDIYKDGIVTEAEKEGLRQQLSVLDKEKREVVAEIDKVLSSTQLVGSEQYTALNDARAGFVDSHTDLVLIINKIIGNDNVIPDPPLPDYNKNRDISVHFPHFSDKHSPSYPDMSVIMDYNGLNYLFDGGEIKSVSDVEWFLSRKGISKIDKIFVTHQHSDHIEGLPLLMDKFGCKELYLKTPNWSIMPPVEIKEWRTKELHDKLKAKATEIGATIIELDSNRTIALSEKSSIEVFNVNNNEYIDYNNISLGYLFKYKASDSKSVKVFIAGDMTYQSEENVGGVNVGKVDILKLGHHGNTGANGEKWLSYLKPDYSVATIGYPRGKQVEKNAMRCKFEGGKVYLPNSNKNYMGLNISKDTGAITTDAVQYKVTLTWYQRDNADWYYFKDNGEFAKSETLRIDSKLYDFDATGKCLNPNGRDAK